MSNKKRSNTKNELSLDEEKELFQRIKEGEINAKDILIESFIPYAKAIAIQYANKLKDPYTHKDNFIAAAYFGLVNAAKTWDFNKGRFKTHSYSFIYGAIIDEMREIKPAKIANSLLHKNVKLIKAAQTEFLKRGIEQPDLSQFAEEANISIPQTKEALEHINFKFINPDVWNFPNKKDKRIRQENSSENTYIPIEDPSELENETENNQKNMRIWEFSEEDIGVIYPKISEFLLKKWFKEDPLRHGQLKLKMKSSARCIMRRNLFLNGSQGKLDVSILRKLYNNVSGSEAYDRRRLWKDYSLY